MTSSPDAENRAREVLERLSNATAAQRAIIDSPQYGTVEKEAARLTYAALLDARETLAFASTEQPTDHAMSRWEVEPCDARVVVPNPTGQTQGEAK